MTAKAGWSIVAVLMAAVVVIGVRWGTFAVGGSDSSCYVIQAVRWAALDLQPVQPLALEAPWPVASSTFAVTGHVASATVPGAMVPICASGLPMLMAVFSLVGGQTAMFLVVPFFGALLIGAVYSLGVRLSPRVGVASAALTAASPVFLFQVVQPMSDIPAAALWCLTFACAVTRRRRALVAAGLLASLAILVRPNLVPIGVALGLGLLAVPGQSLRERIATASVYAAAAVPGCLAVALINWYLYGSPLSSGYGPSDVLFSATHIAPNLQQYGTWLWQTETPLLLLAGVTPFLYRRWLTSVLAVLFVVNVLCYLPYVVFQDWQFLRFLLPTLPVLLILSLGCVDWVMTALMRREVWADLVLGIVTVSLISVMGRTSVDRSVFRLQGLESRFIKTGAAVASRLPRNAMLVTAWESGSVTYYAKRLTLAWDQLDSDWLDMALTFFSDRGYEPYILTESWEEAPFRRRFVKSEIGKLDWPPAFEIAGQVRIYRPGDRARYYAGESVRTEYVR